MARGINKAILVGNLGNDPEHRSTASGMAVTRVSLATTSVRKDRDGNAQERTEWHRVVFFGRLAEIAAEYLCKGSQVYIEGEIRYDKYTDKDGVEKYSTDIVANAMQMLGGRGDGGRQDAPRHSGGPGRAQSSTSTGYARDIPQDRAGGTGPVEHASDGFDDDDIPFISNRSTY